MKNENILDAIGMINDEAVRDAKAYKRPKSRSWLKWGAVAACLCLVVFVGIRMGSSNDYVPLNINTNSPASFYWVGKTGADWPAPFQTPISLRLPGGGRG